MISRDSDDEETPETVQFILSSTYERTTTFSQIHIWFGYHLYIQCAEDELFMGLGKLKKRRDLLMMRSTFVKKIKMVEIKAFQRTASAKWVFV